MTRGIARNVFKRFIVAFAFCLIGGSGSFAFARLIIRPGHSNVVETIESISTTPFGENVVCYKDSYLGRDWAYCITRTKGSANPDVLFDFHGLGENEHSWIEKKRDFLIRQAWHTQHLQAPTVVSVSFGSVWLLAQKNSSSQSGLFELFENVVYPTILRRLGPIHGQKILLGASMGGFNATQIYLKTPKLFNRYVLISPIIANVTPYSPSSAISQYISQNNAEPFRVYLMMNIAKSYFPTAQSYNTAYPFSLAQKVNASYPPIYLSCSYEDPYGIFNGVKSFKNLLKQHGVNVEWRETHGPHCTIDANEVARVLVLGHT